MGRISQVSSEMKTLSDRRCIEIFAVIDGNVHSVDMNYEAKLPDLVRAVIDAQDEQSGARLLAQAGWIDTLLCARAMRGIAAEAEKKTPHGDLMRMILKLNQE